MPYLPSRRDLIRAASTAALATAAGTLSHTAHAAGTETLRLGLVGCGGRGTGAAANSLDADPNVKLVAVGDAFADKTGESVGNLQKRPDAKERVDVPADRQFSGFDAYKHVIDACDVVILATPPHFRSEHIAYAVEKGKHIFAEKPVATDAPHVRATLEACKAAQQKGLTIVSGLCWRYHEAKQQTLQRVLDGDIGDIISIETTYNASTLWHRGRGEQWSDMEWQLRNWLYFTWAGGDHITEQAIHSIDKMGWVMGEEPPTKCWGVGGRQVRTDPKFGNAYDHFSIVYEYANGVRGYHQSRQIQGASTRVADFVMGTKGTADVFGHKIDGEKPWRYKGRPKNMYVAEHEAMYQAIRSGKPINNGLYMCHSTMLSIMGRTAAYTGQDITWDQAWKSNETLGPAQYAWGPLEVEPVAMPGRTKQA